MSEPTGNAEQFDSRYAHRQCKRIVLGAIMRAEVDESSLDEFAKLFLTPFENILTKSKGRSRWSAHGEHVRFLARLLGSLAEFHALRDPVNPQTVGYKDFEWALGVIRSECKLGLEEAASQPKEPGQRFLYCPV